MTIIYKTQEFVKEHKKAILKMSFVAVVGYLGYVLGQRKYDAKVVILVQKSK